MGRQRSRKSLWIALALAVLLVVGLAFRVIWLRRGSGTHQIPSGRIEPDAFADSVVAQLPRALAELGIRKASIVSLPAQRQSGGNIRGLRIRVPKDLPLALCNLEITRLTRRLEGRVLRAEADPQHKQVTMRLGTGNETLCLLHLVVDPSLVRETGQIALIIDDFTHRKSGLANEFCALRQPVSLSVLPVSDRCKRIVAMARRAGRDVLLHMPMEPLDFPEKDPGEEAILASDSEEAIHQKFHEALKCLGSDVQGVSNHMGSRVTADRRLMEMVIEEVKRRGLFFVDSRTSSQSLAFDVASEKGVRAGRNRVFIDEYPVKGLIADRLFELAYHAAQDSGAIGIGHSRELTLEVLRETLPRLEKRGFQFVKVSEIVR